MNFKNAFLRGTLLLTTAGLLSRFMGFFYRIFLANTIGAEGMGIYQLIFPVYSVCFSLCASGIETAVSKLTAAKYALGKPDNALRILYTALFLTTALALCCSFFIYRHAHLLSVYFLKESRCEALLKILAFTIPLGTVQSCICGYYFGIHKAGVPSFAQLIEQTFRILSVWLLYRVCLTNHIEISASIAVLGLVLGELCSLLFTITCFTFSTHVKIHFLYSETRFLFKELLSLAGPLTVSRICVNLLASLEAAMIPDCLKSYGMNTSDALSIYGILTGMALPFILFPNALTGSISLMLLPEVSESQACGHISELKQTIRKTFSFCLLLGLICFIFFFLSGDFLGIFIFSNKLAGQFIRILSWICPFLYLNTTLNSILNGLGRTDATFFNGICALFIRIGFVFFVIPQLGIYGYLLGLLVSQLFTALSSLIILKRTLHFA